MDDRYSAPTCSPTGWRSQAHRPRAPDRGDRRPRGRGRGRRVLRSRRGRGVRTRRARGSRTAAVACSRSAPGSWSTGATSCSLAARGRRADAHPRGRHPVRSPRPTPARASRGPAGSSSRAGTTPSSSRRCGATTCAPRVSSSSTCRASTCSKPRSTTSRPPPTGATACSSTTSWPARRSPASRTRSSAVRTAAHVRIVGHPYVDVWQCVTPRAMGIATLARRAARHRHSRSGTCRALGWPVRDTGRPRSGMAADPRRGLELSRPRARRCSAASRSSSTSSRRTPDGLIGRGSATSGVGAAG